MKYYRLKTIGVNRKEVGVSPQSTDGYFGDIQKDFIPFEGKIDFNFKLPIPILREKANLTTMLDVVMITPRFLIVENQFIDVLKGFNIGYYQHWPIQVDYSKKFIKGYNLFYLTETKQNEYIDFKKSEFYLGSLKDYKYVGKNIKIQDYENFLNIREIIRQKDFCLKHRKVVLNLNTTKEDMFRITNSVAGGYYISEKLKNEFIKKGFTGMVYREITADKKVEVIY